MHRLHIYFLLCNGEDKKEKSKGYLRFSILMNTPFEKQEKMKCSEFEIV